MTRRRIWLAALAVPALLAATPSPAKGPCDNTQDQGTMNRCAADDFARADKALSLALQAQMKTLDDHGRDLLKTSQRAWLSFRDAECRYLNEANEDGSIYPLVYNGCLTTLTKARTTQIKAGQN